MGVCSYCELQSNRALVDVFIMHCVPPPHLSHPSPCSGQKLGLLCEEEDPQNPACLVYCGYCETHWRKMVSGRGGKRERGRTGEEEMIGMGVEERGGRPNTEAEV